MTTQLPVATLDFESFWDTDYSLARMSPLEYVMDERFEAISLTIKVDDYPTDAFWGEREIAHVLKKFDWSRYAVCAHNMSGFDSYVLAYRYGVRPRLWMCTLAMARPIHAKTTGLSLAALVEHYAPQLQAMGIKSRKDNRILLSTKGKRAADFTREEREAMLVYNTDDTEQDRGLFKILKPHYTSAELWQIDAIVRMRTEPQFALDRGLLETAASVERDRKRAAQLDLAQMLGYQFVREGQEIVVGDGDSYDTFEEAERSQAEVLEFVRANLASASKFADLLTKRGVPVPMKPSPTNPENAVPALAKTDEAFIALQEHSDPVVAAAARARLDVKSTLLETRIQKFLTAGRLAGGRLPVPLKYCGADTTGRDSGEEYNPQNMPRITPGDPKPSDALRRSLRAPEGYAVIVADQSGIELRVNHFLWQVASSMELYRASPDKADLYKAFAAANLYKVEPDEITKPQRQIGKIAQLGLGFGAGAPTFQRIAKIMGRVEMPLTAEDGISATGVVGAWRGAYPEIVDGWRTAGACIPVMASGHSMTVDPWGLVTATPAGFVLPSKRVIRYPDLREEDDGRWPDDRPRRSWFYGRGRHKARITGPKAVENIVQALARDSIFDCAIEFYRRTGLRPALRVHDELVYVVPYKDAQRLLTILQGIMRTPPRWWPELVVWSEGDMAETYGDAK